MRHSLATLGQVVVGYRSSWSWMTVCGV